MSVSRGIVACVAFWCALGGQPLSAQVVDATPPAPQQAAGIIVADGVNVTVSIESNLDSKSAVVGARFPLRLVEDLVVDGAIIAPAGTMGEGEIIHAARARAMGKAGELILAARHLDIAGQRLPLRGLKLGMAGERRATEAAVASGLFAPLGFLIVGGELRVAKGTLAGARTKGPITWQRP